MTEDPTDSRWLAEVVRLHQVIAAWTTGAVPNDAAHFAPFAEALVPDFVIINPEGHLERRDTVVARFRARHGEHKDRGFAIEIHQARLRWEADGQALAVYHEHWLGHGVRQTAILASALLERAPEAPGGLGWRHLHETWLPAAT